MQFDQGTEYRPLVEGINTKMTIRVGVKLNNFCFQVVRLVNRLNLH